MFFKGRLADFGLEHIPVGVAQAATATSLLARLTALGIPVISTPSVERYKALKIREAKQPGLRRARMLVEILSACLLVGGGLVLFVAIGQAAEQLFKGAPVAFPFFAVAGALVALAVGLIGERVRRFLSKRIDTQSRYAARWHRTALNGWGAPVPDDARRFASLIGRTHPEAVVSVDWFDKDPFEVVELDGEVAYVLVWNEDRFA